MNTTILLLSLLACGAADSNFDTADTGLELDTGFGEALQLRPSAGPRQIDRDGDGFPAADDCNDLNPSIHPGADEVCDGIDNDCDGLVDDADAGLVGGLQVWADRDGDGWGDPADSWAFCDLVPSGWTYNAEDCDDTDAGQPAVYFPDADGDGCGSNVPGMPVALSCDGVPDGYADNHDDCDDTDPEVCGC